MHARAEKRMEMEREIERQFAVLSSAFNPIMDVVRKGQADKIYRLKSAIANGEVDRGAVEDLLLMESRAVEQIAYRHTKDEMAEIINVAKDCEMLNGCYKGFERDKQKVKEGRRRLEEHYNNLPPHWDEVPNHTRQIVGGEVPARAI